MNAKALRLPTHRAAVERSEPIGNAFAVAYKIRSFRSQIRLTIPKINDNRGHTSNKKITLVKQTALTITKISRPIIQIPIIQTTS